ncbi:MAG: ABC transporter ATP-binding protein [Bacteroidota bacterium]
MLKVNNISFAYDKEIILNDLTFSVDKGEHLSVIGESGSGKSTLLKLIYGEYDLDQGHLFWNAIEILGPSYNLVVGYDFTKHVSQEFDLMPFTSVAENIGKFLSNFYPEEKQQRIQELIKVVELEAFADTKVKLLSGGQKQRVALARALAKSPELLLLDEPFSHIDNFKKQSLRRKLFRYLKDNQVTCIVATHDKDDVLGFSDQMIVLHDANIIAKDTPEALYQSPKLPLIASFFGEFSIIEPYGILYANQISIVEQSDLNAVVLSSYFKGDHVLIEAEHNSDVIFIQHHSNINPGASIAIRIKS